MMTCRLCGRIGNLDREGYCGCDEESDLDETQPFVPPFMSREDFGALVAGGAYGEAYAEGDA